VNRSRRRSSATRLVVACLLAAAPVLVAQPAGALPGQDVPATQRDDAGQGDDAGGAAGGGPAGGTAVDVLEEDSNDIVATLDGLDAAVQAEVDQLIAARAAQATAQSELDAAVAAVAATEGRIADLDDQSDAVVVDAFVNPPSASALDVLSADTVGDATVTQSILTAQSDASADVLDQLAAAKADLEVQKDAEDTATEAAEARAADAEAAVTDLASAQSRESLFVIAVQDAMAANLSEAEALASVDPVAAEALRARQAEIAGRIGEVVAARQAREAEAALQQAMADAAVRAAAAGSARSSSRSGASGSSPAGAAASGLATVACPGGGSITVAGSIARDVSALLSAASADGLDMCGGGYRDPAAQIALRRAHCGTSNYAIYEAPASSCSPPTARPGTSNHETGLAIDFTCGGSSVVGGSACFRWLQANAARYGLYNLPAEAWHWSTDGT
jgi:LAS superfamily LD-carboxypeptidase LdcB